MAIDKDELIKRGAQLRIEELENELAALRALVGSPNGRVVQRSAPQPAPTQRRPMSAAARKAVGLRMKRYWAERRAGNKKGPASAKRGAQKAA